MSALAVFDLDYTLTMKGTWGRFVSQAMRGNPLGLPALWMRAGVTQLRYKSGSIPRIAVKTAMMKPSIVGWDRARLNAMADSFVADDMSGGMDDRIVEALRDHQAAGDTVLIASAAIDALVERYADALGADGFVATELLWDGDRLAQGFASENCYGPEKLRRVRNWLGARGIEPSHVTAYSDSRADAPLLEWADRPVVVRPKAKTRRYAEEKGFETW